MFISFLKHFITETNKKSLYLSLRPHLYRSLKFSSSAAPEELIISQSCIDRLKQIAPNGEKFLRITIDGGGCSGFQYRFDLDDAVNDDDVCISRNGTKIIVDKLSLDFLKGSTVEYKEELIRSSFRIVSNPQADSKCSCGASFSVKAD